MTGSFGVFTNQFYDYVELSPIADLQDDFRVYKYRNERAQFFGIESQVKYHIFATISPAQHAAAPDLALFVQPDWVWAEKKNTGEPLPRIPALRLRSGLEYVSEPHDAALTYTHIFRQARNAEFETDTAGSGNLQVEYEFRMHASEAYQIAIFARSDNLLDETIRNHVSFIKDVAPLPGANVISGFRVTF